MNKEQKYLLFIVLLLAIGIGYAFLTVDLKINGYVGINDGRWNVHFENYEQTDNSTITPASGYEPNIVDDTTTEISYAITFQQPGDFYEFTIDIVNGGTMDASIISLEKNVSIDDEVLSSTPAYLNYSVTYSNGNEYSIPHSLAAEATDSILVKVEFKRDITLAQLAEVAGKTLEFSLKPIFVQGDGSDIDLNPSYLYSVSSEVFYVGQAIPDEAEVYTNYEDVDSRVFLRHKMANGVIEKTDIGFIFNKELYYIPPYQAENREQFERTISVIRDIYEEGNCVTASDSMTCLGAYFYYTEDLSIYNSSYTCVANDLYSYCE